MVISLTICSIITHMQYGLGLIEDSFAADLNTEYMTSALFMTFYGICNFYVFTLAAVYSPTKKPGFGKYYSILPFEILINIIIFCFKYLRVFDNKGQPSIFNGQ